MKWKYGHFSRLLLAGKMRKENLARQESEKLLFFPLSLPSCPRDSQAQLSLAADAIFSFILLHMFRRTLHPQSHTTFHFSNSYHKQEVTWNYTATSISCRIDFECPQANSWKIDQWFKTWWPFCIRESGSVNFETSRPPCSNSMSLTHVSFSAYLFCHIWETQEALTKDKRNGHSVKTVKVKQKKILL